MCILRNLLVFLDSSRSMKRRGLLCKSRERPSKSTALNVTRRYKSDKHDLVRSYTNFLEVFTRKVFFCVM